MGLHRRDNLSYFQANKLQRAVLFQVITLLLTFLVPVGYTISTEGVALDSAEEMVLAPEQENKLTMNFYPQ